MANWNRLQRDFSGGEVSPRMFMRDDTELHAKACLVMENFMPTLQGTALRTPGTRYLWKVTDGTRIIPYITPNNQKALVELLPNTGSGGDINIRQDISQVVDGIQGSGQIDPDAPQQLLKRFVDNDNFHKGFDGWTVIDEEYTGGAGDQLGWVVRGTSLNGRCRVGAGHAQDRDTCTLSREVVIPEDTDQIQIAPKFRYVDNFIESTSKFAGTISVGTTAGGTDVFTYDFSDFEIGQRYDAVSTINQALTAGTSLFLTFTFKALQEGGVGSAPVFTMEQFLILSKATVDVNTITVATTVPYTAEELKEVQYVQSPYNDSGNAAGDFGNELVLVHPNHPPKRLYFNAGYIFADIPFVNPPDAWTAFNSYPAACTSHLGRLVLAGSTVDPTLGSLSGSNTETVWCTEVGKWNLFTDPNANEVNPDDSIEFTSTYRSPIHWVLSQKNLLIGAESMEYVASADGIFSPGDLGVNMQSTHGSSRVQPVGMGQYALFAAEQGSRVRAMQYIADDEGWVAPDMTLAHPDLFADGEGIVRMVRMRNPHQIMVAVMGNGQLALLHQDSYAKISGWSRINMGNQVRDAVVLPKSDGTDVLYVLVERTVGGSEQLYLEAIVDWTYANDDEFNYTNSAVTFVPASPTNVITGLDHLEGRIVQVVSNRSFLGSWQVKSGSVTLLDGTGSPINVSEAVVGIAMTARMRTMPLITQAPGALKRYSDLYVRVLNSSRPLINGRRPEDRDPLRFMGEAQDLDIVKDFQVEMFGWNRTQIVDIRENLPVRTEVIGIFGGVKGNET